MSKTGGKSPPRPAPASIRLAAPPRPGGGRQPREVFGRFFETLGRLDSARSDREGAR